MTVYLQQHSPHSVHQMCLKKTTKGLSVCKNTHIETNHRYLGSMIKGGKKRRELSQISESLSPHIFHSCPKGTLSLVYWQQHIAMSTLH